jgi:DNA-binding LytR/AlgR family response regulator
MKTIKAAIIEDEIPAARMLTSMISSLRPSWEVTTIAGSVEDSINWFKENEQPDILFLDIHLSDGNSFSFLEEINLKSMLIFTTAFDEYALQAFKANSIDYLLKPISKDQLSDSIIKFEKLSATSSFEDSKAEMMEIIQSIAQPLKKYRTRFLINTATASISLLVKDIAFFYSEQKVCFAVTYTGKDYPLNTSLDKLVDELDPDSFFRVNRQIIVCVNAITKIEPYFHNKIIISTKPTFKENITVSKERAGSFKRWLNF